VEVQPWTTITESAQGVTAGGRVSKDGLNDLIAGISQRCASSQPEQVALYQCDRG
jgi:hypothetical protein